MGGCPDSGSLLLARLALSLSRPFACRLRLILGFLLTGGLRLWRGRRLRRFFFPALEPFLPECPLRLLGVDDPPRLLLLGLKLLGLFMDTHQKPPLILTGTDRRTHTHTLTNTNAQRDSWPWKYSCSRLHLSSCTSRIYPGSPSSAPGFSWAYFWFGHLGIGV